MRISILDTTLRDGEQGRQFSFELEEKLRVCQKLDEFGIDYIEAGWPASNPRDAEFFQAARRFPLRHARLTAFGYVRHKLHPVDRDPQVVALLAAETPAVSVAADCRGLTAESHLIDRAAETIHYLYERGREVIFDASHFFEAYTDRPEDLVRLLVQSGQAGASILCLADTFGGTDTIRLARVCAEVRRALPSAILGIHAHNDLGLAAANTLAAVQEGFTHVQGCVNGYGEGCGNADLCPVIATLELKLGHETIGRDRLPRLAELSRFVAEAAGMPLREDQPWVGRRARTPWQRPGGAGPHFREGVAPDFEPFRVLRMEVSTRTAGQNQTQTQASVTVEVNGAAFAATSEGEGPIHALDRALKQCIAPIWPQVNDLELVNYTLRVLETQRGTAALARVLIEWRSREKNFCTVGVSENLILASWMALLDAAQVEIASAEGMAVPALAPQYWGV